VSGIEEGIPQGLKPLSSPDAERPEAEASGYLEARLPRLGEADASTWLEARAPRAAAVDGSRCRKSTVDSFCVDVLETEVDVVVRVQPRAVRYWWISSEVRAE
jgi:hypothetical protein